MTKEAPVNVSPLIKSCRWSLLIAGIFYGFIKHSRYSIIEKARREEEEKGRAEREAALAAEKARRAQEEIDNLTELLLGKS